MTTTAAPEKSLLKKTLPVINPATGETVHTLECQDAGDIDHAVIRSGKAQRVWASLSGEARSVILWRWGELVEKHFEQIAQLDVKCTGKVIRDARAETKRAARHARYWAGMADKLFGEQLADVPGRLSYTYREPLGVYAVVLPWNAPAHSFMARSCPALACGNSIIVKPSELSPLSAQRLAELAFEAGMPEDLVLVVTGDGATGGALCAHPLVAGISFTGSAPTGKRVLQAAADTFKKVVLELGGKSPIVVFDDADFDSAVRAALSGVLTNAGQICAASSRLLVHKSIAPKFVAEMSRRLGNLKIGDPSDPDTQVGPVVCRAQYEKVIRMIETAASEGATVAHGGGKQPGLENGFFVAPTIFTDVKPEHEIGREEVFGPVLSVVEFETEAEALELCNGLEYGLAAYVWTRDASRLLRMMKAIEAGVVHGNTPLVMDSPLPFGGFKHSGLGGAFGTEAIEGCTQTKRVTIRMEDAPLPEAWAGI